MSIAAIDPGVAGGGCAVAVFDGGRCRRVQFMRHPGDGAGCVGGWQGFAVVVVERPEYQGGRTQQARPTDLMDLAWEGALLATHLAQGAPIIELKPSDWKGMLPKPVHHDRLWGMMSRTERALFPKGTYEAIQRAVDKGALDNWKRSGASYYSRSFKAHNILDAWGIGRYYEDNTERCLSRFARMP